MVHFAKGGPNAVIDAAIASQLLDQLIEQLRASGPLRRLLLVPPDRTRADSGAGELTCQLCSKLSASSHLDILPATGTHKRMKDDDVAAMFPGVPRERFLFHDHQNELELLGTIPSDKVQALSEGILTAELPVMVNRLLVHGGYDHVISIGQLVPHEVIGIANHCKNIFIGLGGRSLIDASHYLGAVHGMERIMGRVRTPVRALLEYVAAHFGGALPITYLLTVRTCDESGQMATRGLFAGDDNECYMLGAELCRSVNLFPLDRPAKKVIAWMNPDDYTTGWVANKAIYRTRMAIADSGDLVVLAPGMRSFGENETQETLIRKFGFRGTPATLASMRANADLGANLGVVAHLIHGSSEGRFNVTYCPGNLSRDEIEGVGFRYGDLKEVIQRFDPARLKTGWNTVDGEEIYFVRNPGQGLWGTKDKLNDN